MFNVKIIVERKITPIPVIARFYTNKLNTAIKCYQMPDEIEQ